MKRAGNLFDLTFSRNGLFQAYLDARKKKRSKRSCFEFERALGPNLRDLHREIHDGTYRPRPYFRFIVREPKERVIYAPAFRDCVVQHAIYRVVYPIFNRTFVSGSFACRTGYGTHKASDYVQRAMRQCDGNQYVLQLDVRKFFYRIDRGILKGLVGRKIKDRRLVDMMMQFADHEEPLGIPIGNLLSQLYALIYLNPLDHYIKRELRVDKYARYVDDFLLIGLSRDRCLNYRQRISDFLRDSLHLELSKSSIRRVRYGVNFVGYRTWRRCRVIRKHGLYKFRRAVRAGKIKSVVSLLGHARRTQSLNYMMNMVKETDYGLYNSLPIGFRRLHRVSPARA